jgi:hypothetical protein
VQPRYTVGTLSLVLCPKCSQRLVAGSLRCRDCGADTRSAQPAPLSPLGEVNVLGIFQELTDDPVFSRWLDAARRLQELSPALAEWLFLPSNKRGPRPAVLPGQEQEILLLEGQLNAAAKGMEDRLGLAKAQSAQAAARQEHEDREANWSHHVARLGAAIQDDKLWMMTVELAGLGEVGRRRLLMYRPDLVLELLGVLSSPKMLNR